jgi:hypothetical protein
MRFNVAVLVFANAAWADICVQEKERVECGFPVSPIRAALNVVCVWPFDFGNQ